MSNRFNMMKSFSMAALLLASGTFVACSSSNDDIVAEQTNNDAQQVYTMTVQATKGDDAFTRGLVLNEDGTKLSVKWNVGEKVYVLQNVGSDKWTVMGALTATPDAEDPTKATLTGSFGLNKVNPDATALRFVLHKAWMNYNYQEGILIGEGDTPLSSIEDGYDYEQVQKIIERLESNTSVALPKQTESQNLKLLLEDIETNLRKNQPELIVDRLHTFSTEFLRSICRKHSIGTIDDQGNELPLHSLAGRLKNWYAENHYFDSEFSVVAIQNTINIFDKFNAIRNDHSAAHPNEMLNKAEAMYAVQIVAETLTFIEKIEQIKDEETARPHSLWDDLDSIELPF